MALDTRQEQGEGTPISTTVIAATVHLGNKASITHDTKSDTRWGWLGLGQRLILYWNCAN